MGMIGGIFGDLTRVRDARSARSSSWDHTGRNADPWVIAPGQTVILADIQGQGASPISG
jgi:hypothetical protein